MLVIKNKAALILIICGVLLCQNVFANNIDWSKTGHRVIGEVAQQHLNRKTEKALAKILEGQSLATIATFADDIKSDSSYRKFSSWHYVNFPTKEKYGETAPSNHGDVVFGIQECTLIIKDKKSTKKEKVFYIKLLVHLVGDLHQPMHTGRLEDKGGNAIAVTWFGKATNLHRVWDAQLIADYNMSYTELSNTLPVLSKKEIKTIQMGDAYSWVEESQDLANRVYETTEAQSSLGYEYSYKWWGSVENQLQKGGLRLAAILNNLFS